MENKEYNPDIISLHNIHGYYINIEILFDFLRDFGKPIIWTFTNLNRSLHNLELNS